MIDIKQEIKEKQNMINMIESLCVNYTIDKTDEEIKTHCSIVYPLLKSENLTAENFTDACLIIMKTKPRLKSLPTAGEYLAAINRTPKSLEQIAKEQATKVFEETPLYDDCVMFDDPVTNMVIKSEFGGLSGLRFKYINSLGEKRPKAEGKRLFERAYITTADSGMGFYEPLVADGKTSKQITMIGDQAKIAMMLEFKPASNNVTALLSNLSSSMKG